MHLRRHLIRLTLVLVALCPLAALSQNPGSSARAFTPPCIQTADRPCPSATVPIPYQMREPLTLESTERQAAAARLLASRSPQHARMRAVEMGSQYQQSPHAEPDAPDQSELLKNSKDQDFILRNFKTMYVATKDIEFFDAAQMKAALKANPEFQKLNIRIVDDRNVADTVFIVSYTFAWDYPFELRHQNTTTVLLAGKGEGPFSGPLGAADVARVFVDLAKPWRTGSQKTN